MLHQPNRRFVHYISHCWLPHCISLFNSASRDILGNLWTGEICMLGNMEKAPVDIDASNVAQHDTSPKKSHQEDDPKPDYSSKATTKTTLTDYLVDSPLLGCK